MYNKYEEFGNENREIDITFFLEAIKTQRNHSWFSINQYCMPRLSGALSVAFNLGLFIFLDDVNKVHCQSTEKLTRFIAMKPHVDVLETVGIHDEELLKLKNMLCGSGNARDY